MTLLCLNLRGWLAGFGPRIFGLAACQKLLLNQPPSGKRRLLSVYCQMLLAHHQLLKGYMCSSVGTSPGSGFSAAVCRGGKHKDCHTSVHCSKVIVSYCRPVPHCWSIVILYVKCKGIFVPLRTVLPQDPLWRSHRPGSAIILKCNGMSYWMIRTWLQETRSCRTILSARRPTLASRTLTSTKLWSCWGRLTGRARQRSAALK